MFEAKFYKPLKTKLCQCRLCSHFCLVKENLTGLCRVRLNQNGRLYSLVFGYPAAMNLDPVEKKPLFHFQPGSFSFSLGTYGCNFQCANCQNWDISQADKIREKINLLKYFSPQEIINLAKNSGSSSISYTYNEPTIFAEYALAIMKLARENNLKNIWVSNGYLTSECLAAILPYLDAINIDLKSGDENFYKKYCRGRLEPVLENLIRLKKAKVHLEITTLLIPSLTDDLTALKKLADFIFSKLGPDTPWHLSKFSPDISWKLKSLSPASDQAILKAVKIGRQAGLNFVYAGNLPGSELENTYCPRCSNLNILRLGYQVKRFDNQGRCSKCSYKLPIIG